MSDLIRHEEEPPSPTALSRTELKPIKSTDSLDFWTKVIYGIRQLFGGCPFELSGRWISAQVERVEAETQQIKVENETKLIKARIEYEQVQVERKRQEREDALKEQQAMAEIAKSEAEAREAAASARIKEAAARDVERRQKSQDELKADIRRLIETIESLGGAVEIESDVIDLNAPTGRDDALSDPDDHGFAKEPTSELRSWNFDRFVTLPASQQKDELLDMLTSGDMLHELTDTDEFSSAQTETNGAMFVVDDSEIANVDIDLGERQVRATFHYWATALEEQSDLGGTLPIRGSAAIVIDVDGQMSLEDVHAEAVYPGDEENEEPDIGEFDEDDL